VIEDNALFERIVRLRPLDALTALFQQAVDTSTCLSYAALPEKMDAIEPQQLFLDPV